MTEPGFARSLTFRPRLDRVDDLLREHAERVSGSARSLDEALRLPAASLHRLFEQEKPQQHFGRISTALWYLVDAVFKPADLPEDCPSGFSAKSVQVADVFEVPLATTTRTAFLLLWYDQDEPVLVPSPEIARELLDPSPAATLADTRSALRALVLAITDRVNLMAPVARALSSDDVNG